MSRVHHLKTKRAPFGATWEGRKLYEVRRADRPQPFAIGDTVVLREVFNDMRYSGRAIIGESTYVTEGYGVPEGLAVFGVRVEERINYTSGFQLPEQTYEVQP